MKFQHNWLQFTFHNHHLDTMTSSKKIAMYFENSFIQPACCAAWGFSEVEKKKDE